MKNLEKLKILKNVGSSWFSLGINLLVGVFLSPFILHRLGDSAFGIWVLIFSFTGYYGIFDLGIRSSIVRYVSKYTATHDLEEVSGLINTALFTYLCLGLFSLAVTLIGCIYVDHFFHIQPGFQSTARLLLFIVGTSVALGFPLGVFSGMLEGLQKFYILNWTNIVSTLIRVVLIVYYLEHGYGLLTVALITVSLPLLASIVRAAVALHSVPLKFSTKHVNRESLHQIANYSGASFMILVSARLRLKTDAIVIGKFLSSAAIAYFYAGSKLIDYSTDVVASFAQILVPMASHSEAAGHTDRLRKIFVLGNRVCAFISFPLAAVFIILGKSIIQVWVGKKYVALGYPVLLTIIIPTTLRQMQGASSRLLLGISKHKKLAIVTFIEGFANLGLSILLVRPLGILGDALGTAIPMAGTNLLFLPHHVCRQLGIRLSTFVRQAYTLPLVLSSPLVAVLLLMKRWYIPHNYRGLAVQLFVGMVVYGVCIALAYRTGHALRVGELAPRHEPTTAEIKIISPEIESVPDDVT